MLPVSRSLVVPAVRRVVRAARAVLARVLLVAVPLVLPAVAAAPLGAQGADVIRGRITGPDSIPIAGARVTATSLGGNVNRTARTGTDGRFTIVFPGGEGDYWLTVTALGFAPKRYQVKRTADQEVLLADARLTRAVTELEQVRVLGSRNRAQRDDATPDVGGGDRTVSAGNLPAAQQGDLAAMAASVPGVQLVPGLDGDPSGFSVLGLGADQNSTQLNGQNFGGANLPRDAQVVSGLALSPYDVSRGGFSGAQFQLRTIPGSNFKRRSLSLNVDAPALQFTDAAGRALGQQFGNLSLGGAVSGPLVTDKAFYNVAYQAGRRSNDWRTLLNTNATGLEAGGFAPDSVARLLAILGARGVPVDGGAARADRLGDNASLLASVDVAPPGARFGQAFGVVASAAWNRVSPAAGQLQELPATAGDRSSTNLSLQARHSAYFDAGVLSETSINAGWNEASGSPFTLLPMGSVRINSILPDGTNGLRTVSFGGNPFLGTRQTGTSAGILNTLSWFSTSARHRIKLTTELRHEGFERDQTVNRLGTFTYNSLADLEAGRAVSYVRQLVPQVRSGGQFTGAVSLGDAWRVTNDLQLQYGVRVDGNVLTGRPARNAEVEQLFGVRNDAAPNRVYVSPRLGFSWTYGAAPQVAAFDGAVRGPRAVVRGGVGVFQGLPPTTLLGQALDNTGLPGSLQQLGCFGAVAPAQDWTRWLADPATVPVQCADGSVGSPFRNAAPNVTLVGEEWTAPRSVRGNLQWSGPILGNRLQATADVTLSRNLHQASTVDLNFRPDARFTLADEGGRPVFVPVTSVDPRTGATAPRDARVATQYNAVTQQLADLASTSRQFTLRLSPATFSSRLQWSASWVLGRVDEEFRGFASTVGDPRAIERSRALFDTRHQFQYSLGYNVLDAVRVTWVGTIRSGLPYTPLIGADVNGDGLANDRAFVADPARTADPQLAQQMQALLGSARGTARRCLERQLGGFAGRHSCEGPWTQQAFLSIAFNPLKLGLPQRATLSFQVGNPLGALDQLLHGTGGLRGWGQPANPDATLLYVRGFDPVAQRYRYEVNQRFGDTRPAVTAFRTPVTVTALLRFDLGPARERQLLVQQLDRGRRTEGQKLPEPMLQAMYGTNGAVVNPLAQLLRQADTLQLTARQADSIATLNRLYTIRVARLWQPVVKEFAALPDDYDPGRAYARYRTAREQSVDLLIALAPGVRELLTPEQRRKLPPLVLTHLDTRYLRSIRSATVGGGGGDFAIPGAGMMMGGMVPGGAGGANIIIRN